MMFFILFIFGLVIGSFLNVVSLRYDGAHFILDPHVIGGRSHCPSCGRTLRWFELVPLLSFFLQAGRCRRCRARLSVQYPIVELASGLLFVLVPWRTAGFAAASFFPWLLPPLWVLAFLTLLLISVIDIRTGIIPDELNLALGVFAVAIGVFLSMSLPGSGSLIGPLSGILGAPGNIWVGRVIGAAFGFAFFEFLLLITRRKGIGMGDVKLALPLGLLFGWPDILPVVGCAFIIGALAGVLLISLKKKTMQGTLPFGPFLALGAASVFFLGVPIAQWYLRLMGL
jgi:prepilin signal peptidase PulO-like enzyme (type II secretory pathway)